MSSVDWNVVLRFTVPEFTVKPPEEIVRAPVKVPPPTSSLSVLRLVKLASTSLLVRGDPLPLRVTIVAIC